MQMKELSLQIISNPKMFQYQKQKCLLYFKLNHRIWFSSKSGDYWDGESTIGG